MDNFIHTVDKRATAAVWRDYLEKSWRRDKLVDSLSKEKAVEGATVAQLIEEREQVLRSQLIRENTDLEQKVGTARFEKIMVLAEMDKEAFKQMIRVGWTTAHYFRYAARMITFMIRGFSARKLYVEPVADHIEEINAKEALMSSKYQSNWEFLACLSCQPQYRTKQMLDKIYYFIKPLKILQLFPPDMEREVCRYIIYTKFDHGRVLIEQEKRPERFYFVFEGKINTIRRIELSDRKEVIKSTGWIIRNQHMDVGMVENQAVSPDQFVTVGACQLLYIDVDDFLFLRKIDDKIPRIFLQSLPLFKRYPVEKLLQFTGAVECVFYPSGSLVCQNLKKSPIFFICKTGQCAILRRQHITDVKKTKDFSKAHHPDSVGLHKTFFHAHETTNVKVSAMDVPTKAVDDLQLDVNRTSTPLSVQSTKATTRKHSNVEKQIEDRGAVVTKKVFVQIGTFSQKQVLGIHEQDLTIKEGVNNSLSLVSQGCEVIKIHKQRFFHLATAQTLIEVQNLFTIYTLESEVQKEIADRDSWPHFKKNYVCKFLEEKQRKKSLLNPRGEMS